MTVHFTYTPPPMNAGIAVRAAAEAVVESAADVVLGASQALVPVDTGALKASGRVVRENGARAAIVYGQDDGAGRDGQNTSAYAVPQHERMDFAHADGQPKYLETAMHAEAARVAEVIATGLREALQ